MSEPMQGTKLNRLLEFIRENGTYFELPRSMFEHSRQEVLEAENARLRQALDQEASE